MFALYDGAVAIFALVAVVVGAQFLHLEIGQDEETGNGHTGQGTDGIEGLSEIESAGSGFGRTHGEDVGVGGGLKEGESECGDIKGGEEKVKARHGRRRHTNHRADGVERQAKEDAGLVGKATDEQGGGYRHGTITTVESHLHPTALGVVDNEDILEGGNEWIGDVVGKAPQSEEGCDQYE